MTTFHDYEFWNDSNKKKPSAWKFNISKVQIISPVFIALSYAWCLSSSLFVIWMKRRWEPDTSPDLGTSKGLKRLCTCKSSPRPTQDGRNNCKHLPNISPWTESVIRDDELKGIPLSSLCKKRKHYVADDDDGVASSKREKAAERECAGNENVRPVSTRACTRDLSAKWRPIVL